jgi:hypothetical protein
MEPHQLRILVGVLTTHGDGDAIAPRPWFVYLAVGHAYHLRTFGATKSADFRRGKIEVIY